MSPVEALLALFYLFVIFILPVLLLGLGLFVGGWMEDRHYKSIRLRERQFAALPAAPTRALAIGRQPVRAQMVVSSVVISLDYMKRFLAGLRKIFGGRIRAYESLLDRGRREAVLRLKQQAPDADIILNLRLETSTIANTQRRQSAIGAIEVLAWGTAIWYDRTV